MDGWTDGQTGGKVGGWMDGWTDGQTVRWEGRWLDGWKDILTTIYTGTISLHLHIFVVLMMNQDESIFIPIFRKDIVFITNVVPSW
jgi:hypothetical protein